MRGQNDSSAEVDFIWVQDSMIFPIEVKSRHNAHLRSLHSFMDRSSQTVAVRIEARVRLPGVQIVMAHDEDARGGK